MALSTARAEPAGTLDARAASMVRLPRTDISAFKRPMAFSGISERRELEQQSSAKRSVWWAGVFF